MVLGAEKIPGSLSVEEACLLLNRWSDGGFFRFKKLGDKVGIDEILAHDSYKVQLWTQYEDRAVAPLSGPYSGGLVDDRGVPPQPWEIPVAAPEDFADRTVAVGIPHTERVQVCSPCAGSGRIACSPCLGAGRVSCAGCMGMGTKPVSRPVHFVNPDGSQTVRTETGTQVCSACGGLGKVGCAPCAGSGRQVCWTCLGHCRLRTSDQLTVHFRPATLTAILDETELADGQLKKVTGEVLVDERASRIATVPGVNPAVDRRLAQLLKESQAVTGGDSRVLFQRLRVERIPIREVVYHHANSPARRFWIYGSEQRMFAPGAPIAWGRWAAAAGLISAAIAAVILVMTRLA